MPTWKMKDYPAREQISVQVVDKTDIPLITSKKKHFNVQVKYFWDSQIARLKLLPPNKALRITFPKAYNMKSSSYTGAYIAAKRAGIKVSVTKKDGRCWIYRKFK